MKNPLLISVLGLLLACISSSVPAAEHKTWTAGYAAWSSPGAWLPVGVPNPSDEIEIGAGTVILDVPVTISNTLTWSGGAIQSGILRVASGGLLRVIGDNPKSLQVAAVANAGRMEIQGAGPLNLLFTGYGQFAWITNEAPGVMEWSNTANIVQYNPGGYPANVGFANDGLLRKTGPGTNTLRSLPLHNRGTVEVQAGLLSQSGGGVSPGRFKVADSAALDLQTGAYSLQGSVWEGPGPTRFQGSATLYGTFAGTNFGLAGGDFGGSFDVSGGFRWTGGQLVGAGVHLGAGQHRIEGAASKALLASTFANAGNLVIEGAAVGFTFTGYSQRALMTNEAGGVLELGNGAKLEQRNPSGFPANLNLANDGTVRSSAVGTNGIAAIPFHNRGSLEVLSGVLSQSGGGTSPGQFHIADGARFEFGDSTYDLTGSLWSGPGEGTLVGAASVNGVFVAANFALAGTSVSGVFEVTGGVHWRRGSLVNAQMRLGAGEHSIEGASDKLLNNATLANSGLLRVENTVLGFLVTGSPQKMYLTNEVGGTLELNGAVRMEQRNSSGWSAGLALNNYGTLRSRATETNSLVSIPLNNRGNLEVLTGVLRHNGGGTCPGQFRVADGARFEFGESAYDFGGSCWFGPGEGVLVSSAAINGVFAATNFTLAGGNVSGTFDVTGSLRWKSGWLTTAQLRLGPGNHRIDSAGDKALLNSVLANAGTLVVEDTTLGFTFTGYSQRIYFTNEVGGVCELRGATRFEQRNGGGWSGGIAVDNYGTLRCRATETNTIASIPLHNRGNLEVLTGVLRQNGGGTCPGQFRVADGARFEFGDSTYDFGGSCWFGPGEGVLVSSATINGVFAATNFVLAGGSVSGTFDVSGSLRWKGGWLASAQLHLGPGNHRIDGAGDKALVHSILANAGTLVVEDATLGFTFTSYSQRIFFTNEVGGVCELRGVTKWEQRNGGGWPANLSVNNLGTMRCGAPGTNFLLNMTFNNPGRLDVTAGVLSQVGGGTSSGEFHVAEGSRFEFSGSIYDLNSSRWFGPGAGVVAGSATINGAFAAENFVLAAGNVSGSFNVSGGFHWTGGSLIGAQARLGAGSHRIEGAADKAMISTALTNAGVLVIDNATLGFTITGYAQVTVLTNEPGGQLDFSGASRIEQRNGGGWPANQALRNGGLLRKVNAGVSSLAGVPFTSAGTLEVAQGVLQTDNLTLAASGLTVVYVSNSPPLNVSGLAQLGGILQARTQPGQTVTNGAQFAALRGGPITGAFANSIAENPGHLFSYNVGYTANTVTLAARLVAENPVQYAQSKLENGKFTLSLNSQASLLYELDTSTNLVHWSPLLITNLPAGPVTLSDPAPVEPNKFYRVVLFP